MGVARQQGAMSPDTIEGESYRFGCSHNQKSYHLHSDEAGDMRPIPSTEM